MPHREVTLTMAQVQRYETIRAAIEGRLSGEEAAQALRLSRRQVKRLWVFLFVTFAWIFFRAETFADAWTIVRRLAAPDWADPAVPLLVLGLVASVWLYQWLYESNLRSLLARAPVRIALVVGMILYMAVAVTSGGQPFIYFQF